MKVIEVLSPDKEYFVYLFYCLRIQFCIKKNYHFKFKEAFLRKMCDEVLYLVCKYTMALQFFFIYI